MAKHIVATVAEIPPGQRKIVEVNGISIGVFNVHGTYYALKNSCPHQGGELCRGPISGFVSSSGPGDYSYSRHGEIIRCPWHGWEFDIRTGQSWFDPRRVRVRRYDVTVAPADSMTDEGNAEAGTLAKGPYVAETYPVSVEQQLVIVEVPS